MLIASELIALAEECFQAAERQDSPIEADALRERGLQHLAEAHDRWRRDGDER
jgi:hypothetical protein